jgi:hypothetical protein
LKLFGSASVNLLARGVHREMAYPGLRNLTRAFYIAAKGAAAAPISAEDIIAVAAAREVIMILLKRSMPQNQRAAVAAQESPAE